MSWRFLLHISCPLGDVDLILDESKSYFAIRQRRRLEDLVLHAVTESLNYNGMITQKSKIKLCPRDDGVYMDKPLIGSKQSPDKTNMFHVSNSFYCQSSRFVSSQQVKQEPPSNKNSSKSNYLNKRILSQKRIIIIF